MSRGNRSGQIGIGSAISAILKRQAGNKKLHPHLATMPEGAERERSYLRLASQIGARYAGCTLENYLPTTVSQVDVIKKLSEYKEELPAKIREGSGILWYGNVGTGKDHMAAAMLYEAVLSHGYRCRYIRGATLFEQLRAAIGEGIPQKEILRPLEDPVIL